MRQILLFIFLVLLISNVYSQSSSLDSLRLVSPVGHTSAVEFASFDGNEEFVISASSDFSLALWNRTSGKLLRKWLAHEARVYSAQFNKNSENKSRESKFCRVA